MIRAAVLALAFAAFVCVPAHAATHVVTQSGFSFVPADIVILEGDTVQWVQTGSTHTVTSGTGAADPNVGTLFDDPLSSAFPTFEYTFTQVGSYPYFCRPHEAFNMKGTVFVEAPVANQPATWSRIKRIFSDSRSTDPRP